jgi:hypothetical protein
MLNKHIEQLIKLKLQDQHKALYVDYKNSKFLEKVNNWFVINGYCQKLHLNYYSQI